MNQPERTIAIIGGGITGLAAAYRAQSTFPKAKLVLLESSSRLGGVLHSETDNGYLIEHSADMFTSDPPAAMRLCHQLGKSDELLQTLPTPDRAYVATSESVYPVPRGLSLMLPNDLQAVLNSPILDSAAKKRFLSERNVPASSWEQDESLESFAVRRFGKSVFDHLIQPLVGGIYTADPKLLSMQATMARFVAMERRHGSLIEAAEKSGAKQVERESSGARYQLFRAPKQGIGQLIQWLQDALTEVDFRTDCSVKQLMKSGQRWEIETAPASGQPEKFKADGIVMAIPAKLGGQLIQSVDPALQKMLATIEGASSAIVVLGVDRKQLRQPFDGYGIIVPSVLNRNVLATSFASNKFSGRAPDGKLLIRCFLGGALHPGRVDWDDDRLVKCSLEELAQTVGFEGTPEITKVLRWRNCMPQYHLGHVERVAEIDRLVGGHPGLEVAGNSYHGVGIPACIQSGTDAVDRLANCMATN